MRSSHRPRHDRNGDSEKLPDPGPNTYTFETHRTYLWSLINELVGPSQKIVLVIHDWGAALGFNWAYGHPNRVAGIAYMESIVSQYTRWDEWSPTAIPLFQGFRSDKGEAKILDQNMFVERVLFGAIFRELSEKEKAEYRKPFPKREDRWPTLSWPRAAADRRRAAAYRGYGQRLFKVDVQERNPQNVHQW
jgi:haloalkane dehalogenase